MRDPRYDILFQPMAIGPVTAPISSVAQIGLQADLPFPRTDLSHGISDGYAACAFPPAPSPHGQTFLLVKAI